MRREERKIIYNRKGNPVGVMRTAYYSDTCGSQDTFIKFYANLDEEDRNKIINILSKYNRKEDEAKRIERHRAELGSIIRNLDISKINIVPDCENENKFYLDLEGVRLIFCNGEYLGWYTNPKENKSEG